MNKEHFQTHLTRLSLPWYQNQAKNGEEKWHGTIPDKHRYKHHEPNISKLGSTAYYKDYIPLSYEVYPQDTRIM